MDFTFDVDSFSDFYKDVHGFRPRSHAFYDTATTDKERQAMWDTLVCELEQVTKAEELAEAKAINEFEAIVESTINSGASDRDTAIQWLMDAEGVNGDVGFFEYLNGLPYNYIDCDNKSYI